MYLSLPGAEVGVADGGEEHLDADLQRPRRRHLHFLQRQRHSGTPRHRRCITTKTQLRMPTEPRRRRCKRAEMKKREAAGNNTFAFDGLPTGAAGAAVPVRHGVVFVLILPLMPFFFLFFQGQSSWP